MAIQDLLLTCIMLIFMMERATFPVGIQMVMDSLHFGIRLEEEMKLICFQRFLLDVWLVEIILK